jgi:hypothetical protein
MRWICVLFCSALYLGASLCGQETPSQQKPAVSDAPYSFMGLIPGASKAEAVATLAALPVPGNDPVIHYHPPYCNNDTAGLSGTGLEVCNFDAFDGTSMRSFTLRFIDGKVAAIVYFFPRGEFPAMGQAIANKYGQPAPPKVNKLENGFGARFDSVQFTWSNSLSEITVEQRNPGEIYQSVVAVTHTVLDAEFWKRAAANGPKI